MSARTARDRIPDQTIGVKSEIQNSYLAFVHYLQSAHEFYGRGTRIGYTLRKVNIPNSKTPNSVSQIYISETNAKEYISV